MKKIAPLLVVLPLLISLQSFAQLEKGTYLLGGSINFNRSKSEYTSQFGNQKSEAFNFTLAPDVMLFRINRLATGLSTAVSYGKSTFFGEDSHNTAFHFGPIVRYYFPVKQWAFFPEAIYTIGWNSTKGMMYDPSSGTPEERVSTTRTNSFSLGLGSTYFLSPTVGLEGILYYQQSRGKNDYLDAQTDNSSINFKVGFQIYFSRVK